MKLPPMTNCARRHGTMVMEDDDGQPIHTYLAEAQLSSETRDEHPEQPSLDELAKTIRQQLQAPGCVTSLPTPP